MKKRLSEVQIIGCLQEAEVGGAVKDLCRRHGFSEAGYYLWRGKFGGMTVPDAKRLKALEQENTRLKKLLAKTLLEQGPASPRTPRGGGPYLNRTFLKWVDTVFPTH